MALGSRIFYCAVQPPSIVNTEPVIWELGSEHRNVTMEPMSAGAMKFCEGCFSLRIDSAASSELVLSARALLAIWDSTNSVRTYPGHKALQVIGSTAVSSATVFERSQLTLFEISICTPGVSKLSAARVIRASDTGLANSPANTTLDQRLASRGIESA
jgi:hypothetical protein